MRAASDIVNIVSQYTPLRKVGQRWQGLCPFHGEKTASFSVNAAENLYYCFGCQAKGDVITFVQEKEQLDFVGAVEWLAGKANMTLRYTERNEGEGRKRRTKLIEVMGRAVEWYHQRLLSGPDAGAARSYLRARGLDGDVVRDFRIGWAPDSWDELTRALRIDDDLAAGTGLARRNARNRLQDHFRARILFPIYDDRGDPVSFGGRILPGGEGPGNQGKYKNTTETPLYNKSKVLYGLERSKASIVTAGTAVICEGYTDVIGFHRAGVPLAVATCGTALTDDHVRLLSRFAARRLVLAFDADSAGQAAAERFYRWERDHDVEVAVADLPPGQDPADVATSDPAAAGRRGGRGRAVPAVPAEPGVRGRRPHEQRGPGPGRRAGAGDRGRAPGRPGARPVRDGRRLALPHRARAAARPARPPAVPAPAAAAPRRGDDGARRAGRRGAAAVAARRRPRRRQPARGRGGAGRGGRRALHPAPGGTGAGGPAPARPRPRSGARLPGPRAVRRPAAPRRLRGPDGGRVARRGPGVRAAGGGRPAGPAGGRRAVVRALRFGAPAAHRSGPAGARDRAPRGARRPPTERRCSPTRRRSTASSMGCAAGKRHPARPTHC